MVVSRHRLLCNAILLGMFVIAAFQPQALWAQSAAQQEGEKSQATSTATEEPAVEAPLREQTIYIPYNKLRDVFEREGRGVFLPYEKFQELSKAARAKPIIDKNRLAVEALITEIDSEAIVGQEVVVVTANLKIELLKRGWIKVPLRLADAAIRSATLDGRTARIIAHRDGNYFLLIEHETDNPQAVELKLEYARAFSKAPGKNSVSFQSPQAPVNRWRVRVPQEGVKIDIHPMIAATEIPVANNNADDKQSGDPAGKAETSILAFIGAAPEVRLEWTAKAEGATGLTALATAQVRQEVTIDEGVIRTRTTLAYEISRAQLSKLLIDVPADQKVVNVFDSNIRKWELADTEQVRRIAVELFEPASAQQSLVIEMEQPFAPVAETETTKREFVVPNVKAVDVGRQQGTVVVKIAPTLRAEVSDRTGLLQLDMNELPTETRQQNWNFAYRYAAVPFKLDLSIEKVQPKITVEQLVEAYVEPQQLMADYSAIYNIENAGVFQLELKIPAGFEVKQVRGLSAPNVTGLSVDAHNISPDDPTRLFVTLARKAIGRVGLQVELSRRLADENLLSPTGATSTHAVPVLQTALKHIEQAAGRLVVYSPESLRINPNSPQGVRAIPIEEAFATIKSSRNGRSPGARPVLAFAFTEQPANLEIVAERRKPFVTARQRLAVRFESGVIKYESRVNFEVQYSGVKSLRIDLPQSIAGSIRNAGPLRDSTIEPAPNDVSEGFVARSFAGPSELLGHHTVTLTWEQKIGELDVGKSVDVSVPHLRPMGTDRAWGQILLSKNETLDVQPQGTPQGLRPIDPEHDVMPDAKIENAARAMEFHDNWTLNLTATRYQLEEVKRSSIERALVRTIVTRGGQLGVQALFRVRSARQRLTVKLPADVEFDTQPVRINGSPVTLERGGQNDLFVPLVGQNADLPFVLDLRYTQKGTHAKLDLPVFPEDPAIQKVFHAVFLPKELVLIDFTGPWTDDWSWSPGGSKRTPAPNQSDAQLESWITADIAVSASPPFQQDGTMWLFSSIKPQATAAGSLSLKVVDQKIFAAMIFGAMAFVGLIWLVRPIGEKLLAAAMLAALLVGCGVFWPTLANQLFNLPTYASILGVSLLWTALHVGRGAKHLARLVETSRSVTRKTIEPSQAVLFERDQQADDIRPSSASKAAPDTPVQGGDQHE